MGILYEKKGRIGYMTINRPEAFNALDPDSIKEMSNHLVTFRDDPEAWVLILTGAGEKAFCSGADIAKLLPLLEKEWFSKPWLMPAHLARGFDLWKPVIAAINGVALGGGLEMVLASDIRVAVENARLGVPEVGLSVIPGWGGTSRLAHHIPFAKAAEMLFTGQPITAQEALRIGLINEVVPQAELMNAAEKYAKRICAAGPLAVQAAKKIMYKSFYVSFDEAMKMELEVVPNLFKSEDVKEGQKAFMEKRKPEFKGK